MTYPVAMEKDLCLICGAVATQYFAVSPNLPLCGNLACETKLIDEINGELNVVAAEATAKAQGD